MLRIKLKRLADWTQARRENAALYDELLSNVGGVKIVGEADYAESVYHLYVILVEKRDELAPFRV